MLLTLLIFFLVCSVHPLDARAQDSTNTFSVTYIKLKDPSYAKQYEDLLGYYSKKIAEDGIKAKTINGYYALKLIMPSGTANEYDYQVVVGSNDLNVLLDDSTPLLKRSFPEMSDNLIQGVADQYSKLRYIVKTEMFSNLDGVQLNGEPKYVEIDFMKPAAGKYNDYVKAETTTWKAVHKERIKMNALTGWEINAKVLPMGDKEAYDIVTVNFFASLPMMAAGKYTEAFKAAWPKMDINKVDSETGNLRTMVKSDILKPVMVVNEGTMKANK